MPGCLTWLPLILVFPIQPGWLPAFGHGSPAHPIMHAIASGRGFHPRCAPAPIIPPPAIC